jgi:hypothetical protein
MSLQFSKKNGVKTTGIFYDNLREVALFIQQNGTWQDRLFTKADKLRKKIGAEPGAFNPLPYPKPKGMHQKTWGRIKWEIMILEDSGFAGLKKYL